MKSRPPDDRKNFRFAMIYYMEGGAKREKLSVQAWICMGNSHFCLKEGRKRSSTIILLLCYPEGEIPTTGVFPYRLGANFQIWTWKTATSAGRKKRERKQVFLFFHPPTAFGGRKSQVWKIGELHGRQRSKHRNWHQVTGTQTNQEIYYLATKRPTSQLAPIGSTTYHALA